MASSPWMKKLASVPFVLGLFLGVAVTGFSAGVLGSSVFRDVQPGAYYDAAIGEMYGDGIIKGYDNGTFGPNDYVTRGQIAVMFSRFRAELGGGVSLKADDANANEEDVDEATADDTEAVTEEEEKISSSSSKSSSSSSSSFSAASVGPQGTLRFTIKSFTVNEAASMATISIVRTGGNAGSITVDVATSDGTAKAGSDYTQTTSTLSFGSKETSKIFTIPIGDDTDNEGNETFTMTLSNATGGATISAPSSAVITIVDNETSASSAVSVSPVAHSISFNANAFAVQENAGTAVITVKREGGTAPVSVNYAATNGTAIAQDYTLQSGTLNFAQGETMKTFSVTIVDEQVTDGNKTVNLLLTTPTGGAIIGTAGAVLNIVDNETTPTATGSLKLGAATYTAVEGETVRITVVRAGGNAGAVSVMYTTTNGTALAGSDYTAATGTLTFLANETSKIFTVNITKDALEEEGEETINISISNPTGGVTLLSPIIGTIRINE